MFHRMNQKYRFPLAGPMSLKYSPTGLARKCSYTSVWKTRNVYFGFGAGWLTGRPAEPEVLPHRIGQEMLLYVNLED